MKAKDYKIGDKALFWHSGTKHLQEIELDEYDLKMISEYEGTTFEGVFYRPFKTK